LAQAHLSGGQYARVVALLSAPRCASLLQTFLYARYLLAQAHFARRRFELCARVLNADDTSNANQCKKRNSKKFNSNFMFFFFFKKKVDNNDASLFVPSPSSISTFVAAVCTLRGRACVALEQRARAVTWLRRALMHDPLCAEAAALLCDRRLLERQCRGEAV
jgi:hypothetical protein